MSLERYLRNMFPRRASEAAKFLETGQAEARVFGRQSSTKERWGAAPHRDTKRRHKMTQHATQNDTQNDTARHTK